MPRHDEQQDKGFERARKEARRVRRMLKGKNAILPTDIDKFAATSISQSRASSSSSVVKSVDCSRQSDSTNYSIFNIPLIRHPPSFDRTTVDPRLLDPLFPYYRQDPLNPLLKEAESTPMPDKRPFKVCPKDNSAKGIRSKKGLAPKRTGASEDTKTTKRHRHDKSFRELSHPEELAKWISARELNVYRLIQSHPRIPRIRKSSCGTKGFTTQVFSHGDLRTYLTSASASYTSELLRKWCVQAAEAVAVLHRHDIIHGEITPAHFFLDDALDLKISSFHSATVYGEAMAVSVVEPRYRHPWVSFGMTLQEADVFALGGVLYFILTGKDPFHDVNTDEIEQLYEIGAFPGVEKLTDGPIIMKCWKDEVSAIDVYNYFKGSSDTITEDPPTGQERDADRVEDESNAVINGPNDTSQEMLNDAELATPGQDTLSICQEECCVKVLDEDQAATTN